MEQTTIFLQGQVPAQKNSKKVAFNGRTGKPFIMTEQRVKVWQESVAWQLSSIRPIFGKVEVEVEFTHKDRRKRDLDNELSSVMDALKNAKVIEDDNCDIVVKETAIFCGVDKDSPGAKITITPLTSQNASAKLK